MNGRSPTTYASVMLALIGMAWLTGCDATGSAAPSPSASGGTAVRAALGEACVDGGFVACDVLYVAAAGDQDLRDLGSRCGGRDEPSGWCVELHGVAIDPDGLRDGCAGGDMFACDALYAYSPIGSEDEQFGWTCGDRGRTYSTCITEPGQIPSDSAALPAPRP